MEYRAQETFTLHGHDELLVTPLPSGSISLQTYPATGDHPGRSIALHFAEPSEQQIGALEEVALLLRDRRARQREPQTT